MATVNYYYLDTVWKNTLCTINMVYFLQNRIQLCQQSTINARTASRKIRRELSILVQNANLKVAGINMEMVAGQSTWNVQVAMKAAIIH